MGQRDERRYIARLNSDGSLDAGFNPRLDSSHALDSANVWELAGLPDGSVIIGGDFTWVDHQPRFGLARFRPVIVLSASAISDSGTFRMTIEGEPVGIYRIETSIDLVNWTLLRDLPSAGVVTEFEDVEAANQSRRYYRVQLR